MGERAIALVSEALRGILAAALLDNPALIEATDKVLLASPGDMPHDRHTRLCVYLYRIHEHALSRAEAMHIQGPLGFILSYLIVPVGPDAIQCQHILGRVLRALHDHAMLRVPDAGGELQVTALRHPLGEAARLWQALDAPFQCSLCYEVRIVKVGD
jgi:hypothetical protein